MAVELLLVAKEGVNLAVDQGHDMIPSKDGGYIRELPSDRTSVAGAHVDGLRGVPAGTRFRVGLSYTWWKRACANLGIKGVDLYGGTRRSSAIALTNFATPEQIKRATMHTTNAAFERYYQVTIDAVRNVYQATRCNTVVIAKAKVSSP